MGFYTSTLQQVVFGSLLALSPLLVPWVFLGFFGFHGFLFQVFYGCSSGFYGFLILLLFPKVFMVFVGFPKVSKEVVPWAMGFYIRFFTVEMVFGFYIRFSMVFSTVGVWFLLVLWFS